MTIYYAIPRASTFVNDEDLQVHVRKYDPAIGKAQVWTFWLDPDAPGGVASKLHFVPSLPHWIAERRGEGKTVTPYDSDTLKNLEMVPTWRIPPADDGEQLELLAVDEYLQLAFEDMIASIGGAA